MVLGYGVFLALGVARNKHVIVSSKTPRVALRKFMTECLYRIEGARLVTIDAMSVTYTIGYSELGIPCRPKEG